MKAGRELIDHKVSGLNEALSIVVLDEPGQGGACHQYQIKLRSDYPPSDPANNVREMLIQFQNGPILEFGVNGISNEALLTVVIDRLRGFQGLLGNVAPYASRENDRALAHLEEALAWLQSRTRSRMARGVEGKSVV